MIRCYKDPNAEIIIIEREDGIGGQFGSIDYGSHGYFDYGMHIYYESCVPEIDKLFTSLLPEEEWNILSGNFKDASGIFFNGKLQTKCPYVDLRDFPEERIKQFTGDLFATLRKNQNKCPENDANTYDILTHHFGPIITDEVFVPILKKLYFNHASDLDEIATKLTALNRVALFDEELMLDLMKSTLIRARICFPDQYTMPPYRTNSQRGFYPKQFGMYNVLEKFKTILESEGVEFMTSTITSSFNIDKNTITSIEVKNSKGIIRIDSINEVYWTAGLPPLALMLKQDLSGMRNDKRRAACYVNLLFEKKPSMDKLYYFYCFDKGFRTFRVTNYANYCPNANEGRGFPLCVEIWPEQDDSPLDQHVIDLALSELKSFGVIAEGSVPLFAKVEKVHGGGFPLPTVNNMLNMNTIREHIQNCGITNLTPIGVMSKKNIFFIKDILIDAYAKVTNKNLAAAAK